MIAGASSSSRARMRRPNALNSNAEGFRERLRFLPHGALHRARCSRRALWSSTRQADRIVCEEDEALQINFLDSNVRRHLYERR